MLFFQKSYDNWSFYEQRDLMYKINVKNIYLLPKLGKFVVTKKKSEVEDIYSVISSLILIFEQQPSILRLKYSMDNKLKNTILGAKITLKTISFFSFFFRYKNEENLLLITEKLFNNLENKNLTTVGIHIKQNLFDEFLLLYDKFATISEIFLTWHFVNCKKKEEKKLLLSNLLLF